MEEIKKSVDSYIDTLKKTIESQKIKRKVQKNREADQTRAYYMGIELGLTCLELVKKEIEKHEHQRGNTKED